MRSMARLQSAGLLGPTTIDPTTGTGVFSLGADVHRLLIAGRDPTTEEGFKEAFRTGDPTRVRDWLAGEAARLKQELERDSIEPEPWARRETGK